MAENTKVKILKTAEKLMWSEGYDRASLNEIVRAAKVSKGALFHYYPNKQAVTREALDKYAAEHIYAPLEKHLLGNPSPKSGLFSWIEEMYNAYAQWDFKGGCMLGNFALALSDRDEEMRDQIKHIFLQWENMLVSYLKPVHQKGDLLMEPRQFARLFIAMVQGITMTSKVHKDKIRASRDFQALGEFIERMMKG